MPKTETLKFTRRVNAPPAEVTRLFTHATALRDWLCLAAQTEARVGGRLYLYWDANYSVRGTFTALESGHRVTFTWDGQDEPAPTRVQVTVKPAKNGHTAVTLTHSGLGGGRRSGGEWAGHRKEIEKGWTEHLENLQSVAETGIDLRVARRPRLGILIDEFTPEVAARLGVPVKRGIRRAGAAVGTGAPAAGLQKDDVVVKLNGKAAVDFPSLSTALHGLKAGDTPKVVFYRGAQKLTAPLKLSSFPILQVPASPTELAERVRQSHAEIDAGFAKLVEGLTEAQADQRPAENEWSLKEIIAHFILAERDYQSWVADMLNDTPVNDYLEFRTNVNARLHAVVNRFGTVAALLEELQRAQAETADYITQWPPQFVARHHLYRRAAQWVLEITPGHFHDEHAAQLRATIEAAKGKA